MAGDFGEAGNAPVIVIKKIKKGHGGHHGGAWKVAYADFVTAMMAFFLVMWIVGLNKPVKEAVAAYFHDPAGFMKSMNKGKAPPSSSVMDSSNGKNTPIIPKSGQYDEKSLDGVQVKFKSVQEAIEKALVKNPEFSGLKDSIQVHLTNEGLRIELMEKTSSMFFDSGKADLKPRTIRLIKLISKELVKLNNPIIIEGHTDSHPLNGPDGYSNWELSTDRANSARRAMEADGIREKNVLAVRGYADKKLLKPSDPMHFSNRRVSILVAYVKKSTD